MNELLRKCRACQETKEITDFPLDNGSRTLDCRICRNKRNAEIANRKRKENPEFYRQKEREFYSKNRDKMRKKKLEWQKNNPEKTALIRKKTESKECNKERRRKTAGLYREKNRDNYRRYMREYRKRQIQINPYFELTDRIRHAIRRILEKKNSRSLSYTGCDSVREFYEKLSEKTENKNWLMDGYSLDHIFQVNWFSKFLNSPEGGNDIEGFMKILHHHSNLRPIEKMLNSKRSNIDIISVDSSLIDKFWEFLDERIKNLFLLTEGIEKSLSKPMILRGSKEEKSLSEICKGDAVSMRLETPHKY